MEGVVGSPLWPYGYELATPATTAVCANAGRARYTRKAPSCAVLLFNSLIRTKWRYAGFTRTEVRTLERTGGGGRRERAFESRTRALVDTGGI